MQAVILAGGKGTRMGHLAQSVPKPMVPLAGKPILEHQIELLRRYGFSRVIMLTGHLGNVIEDYFRDGSDWGLSIRYHRESSPLGTGGAVKEIESRLDDDFLLCYGDTIMDIDLAALVGFHEKHKPLATLVVHPNNHPYDSDVAELDGAGRVAAIHPKPRPADVLLRNCTNASLYVLSPQLLGFIPKGKADLDREVFPGVISSGGTLMGYRTTEYIRDIGIQKRLEETEQDVLSGKVARLNRRNARKAVFLDRDGVLNVDMDRRPSVEGLRLLPGVAEAVRRINQSEYLAVVVTNQPTVAKGWLSIPELERMHAKLDTLLGAEHAFLDRIYYCPHHPEKGFEGEVAELKIPCECRKPAPGMILKAAADLNIELAGSWMIGDQPRDVVAGAAAGCKTILLEEGLGEVAAKCVPQPDFVFKNLPDAVEFLFS